MNKTQAKKVLKYIKLFNIECEVFYSGYMVLNLSKSKVENKDLWFNKHSWYNFYGHTRVDYLKKELGEFENFGEYEIYRPLEYWEINILKQDEVIYWKDCSNKFGVRKELIDFILHYFPQWEHYPTLYLCLRNNIIIDIFYNGEHIWVVTQLKLK